MDIDAALSATKWSTRKEGYEALTALFAGADEADDTPFRTHGAAVAKAVADSNEMARKAGVEAAAAFFTHAPAGACATWAADIASGLANTAFKSKRCVDPARAALLDAVAVSDDVANDVATVLTTVFKHKTPKVAEAAVATLADAFTAFGRISFAIGDILKALAPLFEHASRPVRKAALDLAAAIKRAVGPAVQTMLNNTLRPAQLAELETFLAELPPSAAPTRFLRGQEPPPSAAPVAAAVAPSVSGSAHTPAAAASASVPAVDAGAPVADPVDIMASVPDAALAALSASKWKERKEALEQILAVLATAPVYVGFAAYEQVLEPAAGLVASDSNVFVVIKAAEVIAAIAAGLASSPNTVRATGTSLIRPLLGRSKEKKASVRAALAAALAAIGPSLVIEDAVLEVVVASAGDKNPNVRAATAGFVVAAMSGGASLPPASLKALLEALRGLTEDRDADVRNGANEAIAAVVAALPRRATAGFLNSLKDARKDAILALVAPPAPAPVSAPPPAAAARPAPAQARGAPSRPSQAAPVSAPAAARAPVVVAPPETVVEMSDALPVELAIARAEALVPGAILKQLTSKAWKERKGGMEALAEFVGSLGAELEGETAEALVRLVAKSPSLTDSNFQVVVKVAELVASIAAACPSFNKSAASAVVADLTSKLGDRKVAGAATEALLVVAEAVSLDFVFALIHRAMPSFKSPKVHEAALVWMADAVVQFGGARAIKLKDTVVFIKTMFESSNAKVRSAASALIAALVPSTGVAIQSMFADVNDMRKTLVESAVTAGANSEAVEATRFYRRAPRPVAAVAAAAGGGPSAAGPSSASPPPLLADVPGIAPVVADDGLDDVIPREDLHTKVKEKTLVAMSDKAWKTRREAMDAVSDGIKACGGRIEANVDDVLGALKGRFADVNKKLTIRAADVFAEVLAGVGVGGARYARLAVSCAAKLMADKKADVRASAARLVSATIDVAGIAEVLPGLGNVLASGNPTAASEASAILVQYLPALGADAVDAWPLAGPAAKATLSRDPTVRKHAEAMLGVLVPRYSLAKFKQVAESMKGSADKLSVMASVTAAAGADSGASASASASASTSGRPATSGGMRKSTKAAARKSTKGKRPATSGGGSRTTGKRRATTKRSTKRPGTAGASLSSSARGGAPVEAGGPLFFGSGSKMAVRAKKNKGRKWVVANRSGAELEERLVEEASDVVAPRLVALWQATDFNSHNKALELMSGAVESEFESLLPCLDVALKFVSLRLGVSNTSVTIKALAFVKSLFTALDMGGRRLDEFSASVVLPSLVEMLGDSKDAIRATTRELFMALRRIYPASRIFAVLFAGHKSKNWRIRVEAVTELTRLVGLHGLDVVPGAGKTLPALASLLADGDANVRDAGLAFFIGVYKLVGDRVYALAGRISRASKELLEERIRHAGVNAPVDEPAAAASDVPTESERRSRGPGADGKAEVEDGGDDGEADSNAAAVDAAAALAAAQNELMLGTEESAVRAVEAMSKVLAEAPEVVEAEIDSVVANLVLQLHYAVQPLATRRAKHVLHGLMQVFSATQVVLTLSTATLEQVLHELVVRLIDDELTTSDDGKSIHLGLNMLMIKVMSTAARTPVVVLLLNALCENAFKETAPYSPDAYVELVCKSLLRQARSLQGVDWAEVAGALTRLFATHPTAKWEALGAPLKVLKIVVMEMVKAKGGDATRAMLAAIAPSAGVDEVGALVDAMAPPAAVAVAAAPAPTTPARTVASGGAATTGTKKKSTGSSRLKKSFKKSMKKKSLKAPSSSAELAASAKKKTRSAGKKKKSLKAPSALKKPSALRLSRRGAASATESPRRPRKAAPASVDGAVESVGGGAFGSTSPAARKELLAIIKKLGGDDNETREAFRELAAFQRVHADFDLGPILASKSETFRAFVANGLAQVELEKQMRAENSENAHALAASTSGEADENGGDENGGDEPAYLARLRSLQSKYNIEPKADLAAMAPKKAAEPTVVDAPPVEAPTKEAPAAEAPAAEATPAGEKTKSESTKEAVDRLRQRLARIKSMRS